MEPQRERVLVRWAPGAGEPPAQQPSFAEPGRGGSACQRPGSARPAPPSPRRVFLALVEEVEDRGTVVAQGGGKVSWPWSIKRDSVAATPEISVSRGTEKYC